MGNFNFLRFFDKSPVFQAGEIGRNTKAFFVGENVDTRMNQMRSPIEYVREHWHEKDALLDMYDKEIPVKILDREYFEKKEWIDVPNADKSNTNTFSLLNQYDEDDGYKRIFQAMNGILRNPNLTQNAYNAAALLVEFFNIELYNYIKFNKKASNFQGVIYRGLLVSNRVLEEFKKLSDIPFGQRKLGIPLSLMSATTSENVAVRFVEHRRENHIQTQGATPVIFKIHVFSMNWNLLTDYQTLYPKSIVTSLCAVPLYDFSLYTDTFEVMLRGAFFQLLHIKEKRGYYEIEAIMSNANRDHLTTNDLRGSNAGKFFGALVGLDKLKHCSEFSSGAKEDNFYREEIEKAEEKIHDEKLVCLQQLQDAQK